MQYGDYTDDYRRSTARSQDQYKLDRQQRLMITIGVGAAVVLLIGVGGGFALGRATAPKPPAPVVAVVPTETVPAAVTSDTISADATVTDDLVASASVEASPPADLPPATPKQLAPSNGDRINADRVTLKWSKVTDQNGGKITYAFQIQNRTSTGSYTTGQTIKGLSATSYSARVLSVTRRWRVWAVDSTGKASAKSPWHTYKHTYVAPAKPKPSTNTTN